MMTKFEKITHIVATIVMELFVWFVASIFIMTILLATIEEKYVDTVWLVLTIIYFISINLCILLGINKIKKEYKRK